MKEYEYDYTVCPDNSPKVFKAACELIHKTYPNIHKDELLVDVDGSTIQCFEDGTDRIIVYDDYDVGAVYVKSDINLSHLFE